MTEKFSCPEPSEEARRAYIDALNAEPGTLGSVLAAAYAVDVPRIVRAEVERALRKRQEDPLGFSIGTYLAARFPEAAPETCTHPDCALVTPHRHGKDDGKRVVTRPAPEPLRPRDCGMCHRSDCRQCYPSAQARTVAAELTERREPQGPRSICGRASGGSGASMTVRICAHSPGHQGPCSWEASHATISPAERDFLRLWAEHTLGVSNGLYLEAAARRVVEEAR